MCPDLYGHGKSDRPAARCGASLFTRQLEDLLYALSFDQRVHLIGHSLGCVIAANLVIRNPRYYGNVACVAPLLDFARERGALRVLEAPLIGEALMHLYAVPMLVRRRRARCRDITDGRFPARFEEQLRQPGFGRGLLSLIRSGMLADQSDTYQLLDASANDVCVFRGSDDTIFMRAQLERLGRYLTRAEVVDIDACPHSVLLTHPEKIAPQIVRFLQRSAPAPAAPLTAPKLALQH